MATTAGYDNPIPVKNDENGTNETESNEKNVNEESGEKVENPDFFVRHFIYYIIH